MSDRKLLDGPLEPPPESSLASPVALVSFAGSGSLSFERLLPPPRQTWFLMAPSGLCREVKPHTLSPMFDVPVDRLVDVFCATAERLPRTRIIERGQHNVRLAQRSIILGLPAQVDARFIARGPRRATLAIYSRSIYGLTDFGSNEARVRDWLARAAAAL